jgi:Flp pilus assembly protein TadD
MSGATAVGRRLSRRAALVVALALAGVAVGSWWWLHSRPAELPLGPSEEALAASGPEVTAAVRSARERVRREPRSVEAWGLLGQVLLANGFSDDADPCLARAEALEPNEPRWPYLRAYAVSRDGDASFAATLRAVAACRRAGRTEAVPYLVLAELHTERGEHEKAEALCRQVLEVEPDNARAHLDLGMIALAGNDVESAVTHLLRAADDPATRQGAFTQLATAYQRRGDGAAAADWSRRARRAPPDDPWPDPYLDPMQELLAGRKARQREVKRLEAQGRWREAVALLRQMTADDPTDEHAFVILGTTLTRNGDLAGAEEALRRATTVAPGSADPHYSLAVVLIVKGERLQQAGDGAAAAEKYRAAMDVARRATEIKPDHGQAHGVRGVALKRLGRHKEAIEALRAAARCRPEDPEVHLALGEALAENGQKAEAVSELTYASDLADPRDPRFRKALDQARAEPKPGSWLWP